MKETGMDGLLILDKRGGITSRDAVDRALRWFPRRTRVGHTGTLDPLATGVLVLCLGNTTRLAEYVQRMSKTYLSTFLLGATSDSDDAEGTVTPTPGAAAPAPEAVDRVLAGLVGTIEQVPPIYSAARVDGRRAYALARRGQEVELRPRPVQVYSIDILRYAYPELDVEVHCGKGTYIRSLARDAGARLGCGAHVAVLRRTRVGPFSVERAVTLEVDAVTARAALLPAERALAELPAITLSERDLDRLCHGQAIPAPSAQIPPGEVTVLDVNGHACVIAEHDPARRLLRPSRVLAQSK